ncbi:hypothetical protein JQ621_14000 [Bradyrhizobium manausense]|uniref:hypothetical protein n=1 Tax=Bradyrhizobium manausense TaxID=989370 RepID=UPI001BAA8B5F|nr:hypothetical protein [Bradyrhizobium manausense]MBR1088580.1 hypothetical protein [Bradyrhizobium manausense]
MNFNLVVATTFYDGPESGFAFYLSGEGVRFSVVAESRFPILRAFGFALLEGNWSGLVDQIVETSPRPRNSVLVFASDPHAGVSTLVSTVSAAKERSHYLGVGQAYLKNIAVMAITKGDWQGLVASNHHNDYQAIHRKIKAMEAGRSG